MPKYRDWHADESFGNRKERRKEQRRPQPFDDIAEDGYWERKNHSRSKWNKKHPERR